jgi:hypothetical protein
MFTGGSSSWRESQTARRRDAGEARRSAAPEAEASLSGRGTRPSGAYPWMRNSRNCEAVEEVGVEGHGDYLYLLMPVRVS